VTALAVSVFGLIMLVIVCLLLTKDLFEPIELTIREVLLELMRVSEPADVRVLVLVRVLGSVGLLLVFCTVLPDDLSPPIELTIRDVLPRLTCLLDCTVASLDVRKFVPTEPIPLKKLRVVVVPTVVLGVCAVERLELTLRG
jgi:hypothetical protein